MDHGSLPHRDGHSHLLNPRFQRVADSMRPLFSTTRDPGRWLRSPVPLASAAAFATTLPRLDLELEPTSQLRGHFTTPRFGLPKNRVCQAVLVVDRAAPQAHLRGRRRQAVRTNLRRAADHRLTVSLATTADERTGLEVELSPRIPGMAAWSHLMYLRPSDTWWGVFAEDGHPLGIAVVSLGPRVAILRTLVVDVDHHAGRYARHLLHAEIVGAVARSGLDVMLVDGPHVLFVDPGIRYFQHLTGYRLYNLRVRFRTSARPAQLPAPGILITGREAAAANTGGAGVEASPRG